MKKILLVAMSGLLIAMNSAAADDSKATISAEWHALVDPLGPVAESASGYLSDPQDPQLRYEMYRALFSAVSVAYLGLVNTDPKHPDFFPYTTQAFNAFSNNPDNDYYVVPIEDSGI